MLDPNVLAVAEAVARDGGRRIPSRQEMREIEKLLAIARADPHEIVVKLVKAEHEAEYSKKKCGDAASAADRLEGILKGLLEGHSVLYRFMGLRDSPDGKRAVCCRGSEVREFPVHPEVDAASLGLLQPWDYACVHEQVVIGAWQDPWLFAAAHGEVVEFKSYRDRELGLVCVAREGAGEMVVTLAECIQDEHLTPESRLVLHRDDPRWAIAVIPGQQAQSKFEVPFDQIETRLEDLAGIEPIARKLIEDVLVHVIHPEIRVEFDLAPMRGFLLSSYQPGMGKTAFMRAFALWLHELGEKMGFETVLYVVPPNAFKSVWHGEDARNVRELWGAIRARQARTRSCPMLQFVILDEVDSLGSRADATQYVSSSAQSDALEAALSEMDGVVQNDTTDGPPAYVLCGGTTNLPKRVDEALKRPGRLGDLVLEMPKPDVQAAEDIAAVYVRKQGIPWYLRDEVRDDLGEAEVRAEFLRPAIGTVFSMIVLYYTTEAQRRVGIAAGEVLAAVHYKEAINRAKKRAAVRRIRGIGVPAVGFDDVMESLVDVAASLAEQMAADPKALLRQLQIQVPVARVEAVPEEDLRDYRYLRLHEAS